MEQKNRIYLFSFFGLLFSVSACNNSPSDMNNQDLNLAKPSIEETASTIAKSKSQKLISKSLSTTYLTKKRRITLAKKYNNKIELSRRLNQKEKIVQVTTIIAKSHHSSKSQTADAKNVETALINDKTSYENSFQGVVIAPKTATIYPSKKGIVTDVFFRQGKWIKKDRPLYNIHSESLQPISKISKSALRQANAQVKSAKAAHTKAKTMLEADETILMQAQNTLTRYQPLITEQAISEQVYEEAVMAVRTNLARIKTTKALIAQTSADIDTAKINVQLYQDKLSENTTKPIKTIVRAPITGIITDHNIKIGQKVSAETVISDNNPKMHVILADINPIYVEANLTTKELAALKAEIIHKNSEQKINLIIENGADIYTKIGRVSFEKNQIVRIRFNNDDELLLPNMKVKVSIPKKPLVKKPKLSKAVLKKAEPLQRKTILIPQSAVVTVISDAPNQSRISNTNTDKQKTTNKVESKNTIAKNNKTKTPQRVTQYVFVVDKDNKAQIRTIQTNGLFEKQVRVVSGLNKNEVVITDSSHKLGVNSHVEVVKKLTDTSDVEGNAELLK